MIVAFIVYAGPHSTGPRRFLGAFGVGFTSYLTDMIVAKLALGAIAIILTAVKTALATDATVTDGRRTVAVLFA